MTRLTPQPPVTALFGGTFDPIHCGHLNMAAHLLSTGHAERIILMPAYVPPHKRHRRISAPHHRLAMLGLAVGGMPGFIVSDHEIRRGEISYTIDTAEFLSGQTGGHLRILIGMDSLADLHLWHRADEMVARYRFLIYARPGTTLPDPHTLEARFGTTAARRLAEGLVRGPVLDISSTEIRRRLRAGESTAGLLAEPVAEYARKHALYT